MKSYREIADSVFARRDQYVIAQRKKKQAITRVTASVGSVALVSLAGIALFQSDALKDSLPLTDDAATTTTTTDGGILPPTASTATITEPTGSTTTDTTESPTTTISDKTEPSQTTTTTAPKKVLITGDEPDEYCMADQDESSLYAMPISPLLQETMEEYEGTDAVYAVLVAIRYPVRDPKSTPDNAEDDPVYYAAYQEFLKTDKIASLIEEIPMAYDEYVEAEKELSDGWYDKRQKYLSLSREFENCCREFYEEFHIKYSEESLEMLTELSEVKPCHLNRVNPQYPYLSFFDNEYHWAVAMYSWRGIYAYSAVLSADAIRELAEQGRYAFWLDSSEAAKDMDYGAIMDTG